MFSGVVFDSVMGRDMREDRIHINAKGMDIIVEAVESLPPFRP